MIFNPKHKRKIEIAWIVIGLVSAVSMVVLYSLPFLIKQ